MKSSSKPLRSVLSWGIVLLLLGSIFPGGPVAAEETRQRIEAIIHLDSTYSFEGKVTLAEIVERAKARGIDAVIFTDDALIKASYGLYPLRRLLRVTVQKQSVFKTGLGRYLREIEALGRNHPDLLLFPGLEVSPFHYWEASPLTGRGVIRDWGKHLLVFGLDEQGFRSLPLVGNRPIPSKPFQSRDLFRLWGAVIIVFGIFCLRKRAFDYRDEMGRALGPHSPLFLRIGWALIFIGSVSLIENYPYREPAFSIYRGEERVLPYQILIDYVQKKGGFAFWAHPEGVKIPKRVGPATLRTDPYPEMLIQTEGYTGYAIFYEGFKTIGSVGGIWDQLLLAYCQGKREHPVWAIGELEYREEGLLGTWIDTVKNVVFAETKSKEAFLRALREGRSVTVRRSREAEVVLGHFWVEDSERGRRAQLGETLLLEGVPRIRIGLSEEGKVPAVHIRLIRDGKVLQEWQRSLPMEAIYEDVDFEGGCSFYRLEVLADDNLHKLVTNPIFVSRRKEMP